MRFEFSDQIRKLLHLVCLWPLRRRFLLRRICLAACVRAYSTGLDSWCDAFRFVRYISVFSRLIHILSLSTLSVIRYLKRLK